MIRIFCLQFDKKLDGGFVLHLTVGEAVEESLGVGFILLVFLAILLLDLFASDVELPVSRLPLAANYYDHYAEESSITDLIYSDVL